MNNNIDVWLLCVFICLFMCIFFNVAIICTVIKYMIFLFYSKFKCAILKVQVQYWNVQVHFILLIMAAVVHQMMIKWLRRVL